MKYGYFDDQAREYVITNPATPGPWANYLGSPEYGALISNNAGGYSFAKSGANGRILRYIFNNFDQPGRYMYIRDNDSKDYWSASWQPVGKDQTFYKSECRHGTAYTKMLADYAGIHSEALYYVPLNKSYEVWKLKLTNTSDKARNLTVTGYAEFTNNSNYEQDQVNLQYSLFITRTAFLGNRIRQAIHGNLDTLKDGEYVDHKDVTERFFGLAGSEVSSFCGDKEKFIGRYHGYGNPVGVENGDLGNETSYNENCCGALSTVIGLAPGESKSIAFVLGMKKNVEAEAILASYADVESTSETELAELKDWWHSRLGRFQVNTPSPEFNTMINTWNAYNCFMTFIWSRAASFIYCGLRNGYGYRDTVQDIQGIIHLIIMTIPTQVGALGFIEQMTAMGLKNSFIPLIIPSIASPACFFYMKQYLEGSLPLDIVEAARIDGSGEFHTFNTIILPIMKPAMAVQAIFSFVGCWNNYFTPALILTEAEKKTLPLWIAYLRSADFTKFDMGQLYMMIALSILPVVVVYLILSKFIVKGVTLGSVKG